ncbi:hypothetical protein C7C46_13490 [Streptomyces tateyamensis]|uniref:Uncharacterized protein n=1 Tax=Streptomyces tateyamensis TaxID=565073 RepID=A0A2V4P5U7_9ACTN|nr:hypothetical protein [Streptomyces tateyamensis]PYC79963.1 hypothetical protein C7C46_13490 [Streptomyces tateyamensis]
MRPSYDAEHPSVPTPIYDELYSEYRRLFRGLPGDRSGEEDMRFTGFAVRERSSAGRLGLGSGGAAHHPYTAAFDGYRALQEPRAEYADQYPGAQQQPFPGYQTQPPEAPQFVPAQQQVHHQSPRPVAPEQATGQQHQQQQQQHQFPAQAQGQPHAQAQAQAQAQQQPSTGQGWVATGYLAPVTLPSPAPPVTVPAPAAPGRHRGGGLLSLPPGQS